MKNRELNNFQRLLLYKDIFSKSKAIKEFSLKNRFLLTKLINYHKHRYYKDKVVFHTLFPPFPSEAFDKQIINLKKAACEGIIIPHAAHISITDECNYNCWHCSRYGRKGKPTSPRIFIKTIKNLLKIGTSMFAFTGGEPVLCKDLLEYLRIVEKNKGYSMIFTTGLGITEKKAVELKKAGLYFAIISLDHYDPEIVNKLRKNKKAFENAINAIKNCKKEGIYTSIQTVVTKELIENNKIEKFLKFSSALGVDEVRFMEELPCGKFLFSENSCYSPNFNFMKKIMLKANKIKDFPTVIYLPYTENPELLGCGAGQQFIYIDTQGNVSPCDMVPLSFGNIKKENVNKIINRMQRILDKPLSSCLSKRAKPFIRKKIKEKQELPLEIKESTEICNSCKDNISSKFYKKLKENEP
ncbi:radical SAM protein [Candidatus Pacearchaeota archaeon]|nr:radical SAM protein [Candidatus Pacearchaeota archaeon]MBD3283671.1 radical SAM protein [Candidatus Pacearchaeota archaeon]